MELFAITLKQALLKLEKFDLFSTFQIERKAIRPFEGAPKHHQVLTHSLEECEFSVTKEFGIVEFLDNAFNFGKLLIEVVQCCLVILKPLVVMNVLLQF